MKGEEAVDGGQVRDGAVTGVEERASRGPTDPDTGEDGAAIGGIDHAPRIGHVDDVDLDPPIYGWTLVMIFLK